MKNSIRLNRLLAATATLVAASTVQNTFAAQPGVIFIATRAPQDTQFGTEFLSDEKGPGMVTPGDVAMGNLLADHGYSYRLLLDKLLGPAASTIGQEAAGFLQTVNTNFLPALAIMSGSSSSADTPPPPPGVPVMMGEHVCLGNNAGRQGSLYMYKGTSSNDPNESTVPAVSKYMKVIAPDHPIFKGIPLDAQGRVKIFRDAYPEEESHVPPGGKKNYEFRWCTQVKADAAPGTTVLGVLDGAEERSCFAVADAGGLDANDAAFKARMVHLFVNENGSGGTRRGFLALTEMGRILFVRAAKWAMGEELQPYKSFRILDVTSNGQQRVSLSWEGTTNKLYNLQASANLSDWSTVVEDIPGADGKVQRTFDLASAPAPLYLRITSKPF